MRLNILLVTLSLFQLSSANNAFDKDSAIMGTKTQRQVFLNTYESRIKFINNFISRKHQLVHTEVQIGDTEFALRQKRDKSFIIRKRTDVRAPVPSGTWTAKYIHSEFICYTNKTDGEISNILNGFCMGYAYVKNNCNTFADYLLFNVCGEYEQQPKSCLFSVTDKMFCGAKPKYGYGGLPIQYDLGRQLRENIPFFDELIPNPKEYHYPVVEFQPQVIFEQQRLEKSRQATKV